MLKSLSGIAARPQIIAGTGQRTEESLMDQRPRSVEDARALERQGEPLRLCFSGGAPHVQERGSARRA
jgi:hypothetical protein